MTKLKTRLPIKALSVLMALLMIFSTMSIMFTVSAALSDQEGGGNGTWYEKNTALSLYSEYLNSDGTISYSGQATSERSNYGTHTVHYSIYMPEGYSDNYAEYKASGKELATMLVLSGGSSTLNAGTDSYSAMARVTGLNYLADQQGIVLIYLKMTDTGLNPNYYWDFFLDSFQERSSGTSSSNQRPLGQISDMVIDVKEQLNTELGDVITDNGKERTYVAGFSAGACLAANMISVYPDRFEGAALVAGMPFGMFRTWQDGYGYGGYANAMYGGDNGNLNSWSKSYGMGISYSWDRQTTSTYANKITSAWSTAGISNASTNADAPRVIVLHGSADNVVNIVNGEQMASAHAIAYGASTTGSSYNQRATYDLSETKDGYTASYYGLNSSLLGDVNTSVGYSKARASRLAFMTFDGLGHKWIAEHAQPLESGNEENQSAMGGSDPRYDYNDIIWDFFEGEPSYFEADDLQPDGEAINPSYGAIYATTADGKYANVVTAQGLTVTNLPISPKHLTDSENNTTGKEWNFNFDLTALINKESAFITDPRYKLTVESIKVYQNVWVSADGATINMGYDVIDSAAIQQGSSNSVALDGVTRIASWTGTPKFQDNQFIAEIPISEELSDELVMNKVLSIVNYSDTEDYNVAAPVIVITFGKTLADPTEAIPGDGNTKTSSKIYPMFAYNSAAGYNAPDTAYETKTYKGVEGHLIGTAEKYSVGVYNAGDNNDKIYYSFDLQDYTILNNKTIQSITIDFALEGNPFYSKEDVGVKVMAIGNMYWDDTNMSEIPVDYITLPESYTLAKGERVEGQIVISSANIINRVNNLGALTLVFENTAENEHYYFLSTMPTITVNYENAKGKDVTELTGIGTRTELGYDDMAESDETGTLTLTAEASGVFYSTSNSSFSSTSQTYNRAVIASFDVYSAAEKAVADKVREYRRQGYTVESSSFVIKSADFGISGKRSGNSGTYYGYGNFNATAQASAMTSSNGSSVTVSSSNNVTNITLNSTTTRNDSYTINFAESGTVFTETNKYLWTKVVGGNTSSGNYTLDVPTLTNIVVEYTIRVSYEPSGETLIGESGEATIDVSASGAYAATSGSNSLATSTLSSSATSGSYYYATVAGYDVYNAAYNQVISALKTKYGFTDAQISEKVSDIAITFVSATASVSAYEETSSRTDPTATLYYSRPSDASAYNSRGSFTTNSTGTQAGSWTIQNGSASSPIVNTVSITFDANHQFSEDNPYLLMRAYSSRTGSQSRYNYAMVSIPELSDVKFTWTADVLSTGESGGSETTGGATIPGLTEGTNDGYVYVDLGDTGKVSYTGTLSPIHARYQTNSGRITSTSANYWTRHDKTQSGTAPGNVYAVILGFDTDEFVTELNAVDATAANALVEQYRSQYPDYDVSYKRTVQMTLSGTSTDSTQKVFYVVNSGTETYSAYNSALKGSSSKNVTSEASTSYSVTFDEDILTSLDIDANEFISFYYGSSSDQLQGYPELTYEFSYEIVVRKPATAVQTVVQESADGVTSVAVLTSGLYDSVKITDSNGSVVGTSSDFDAKAQGNVFNFSFTTPVYDTTYTVTAAKDGTDNTTETKTFTVTGVGLPDEPVEEEVLMDATGNTLTGVVKGDSYKVPDNFYDETRTITSSSVAPVSKDLFPVDGYIVGTNSNYYTNNSADYWTGSNRSTGSPQANVALDTTKTTFPVSYLGYAYMNYDVSSYFDLESPKTLISDNSANPEVNKDEKTDVQTSVITKVYQETVVSGIRVNTIKAQEGYTGGWATRYTIDGSAFVKAGTKWTSTDKPTAYYQALGEASVSTATATLANGANLNDGQLANAREDGFVTIWVNNTGCDWSSRFYPSAWLLVNMPTITVTYKTITYTEKIITETKKVTQATESTFTDKTVSNTSSSVDIQNGYLYGAEGQGTEDYEQTYSGMWGATPSNDTGEHYYTTSDGSSRYPTYRTATTSDTSYFMAQANVEMNSTSLSGGKFAVTYMGSGYAEYNLTDLLKGGVQSEVTASGTTTGVINGKTTEVLKETIKHTEKKVKNITFTITTQAGFTGNDSAADNSQYNLTNVYSIGSFADWSGSSYPSATGAGWTQIKTVNNIKIASTSTNVTISSEENSDVYNALLQNGYLTIRVDNTNNGWDSSYQGAAWTLITISDVTVNYETETWEETKLTATQATDTFKPNYEVYAQYRFTGANGESYSKTTYLGAMEGYGAEGTVTPYVVAPGATHGTVYALFSTGSSIPTNSVVITDKASDNESYKLKRAYVEQTGQDVATVIDNGDGTYTLDTTLTSDMLKTNDTYRIRVIFEYESEAVAPIPESELIKVNLHSVFENYDANGNKLETVGQIDTYSFAKLTNLSYILSLDDAAIPFGDLTVNGTAVSAIAGSNRIYTLDVDKTTVGFNNATSTTKTGTNEFASSNYDAKAYLDITGDTPVRGDILVVTYNGGAPENGEIDVYLYYKATPQYDVTVNYEFDIVGSNGSSLVENKFTYSETVQMSIGDVIFPYDALSTDAIDRTVVSLTYKGDSEATTYKVNEFTDTITATNGITFDEDTLVVTNINSDGSITFSYKMVVQNETNATVNHNYVVNYNGQVIGSETIKAENVTLTAPNGGSIPVINDDTTITIDGVGTFKASQFTPVSATGTNGVEFGAFANGAFAATKVPYGTPNAAVTVNYELNVHKIVVVEQFAQNGEVADGNRTTSVYVPAGTAYTFTSIYTATADPFQDGITLDQYTATAEGATLNSDKGGSSSFTIASVTTDKIVTITYDYATNAQVQINVIHKFYKNGVEVGTKTQSNVAILTNPGKGENSYAVTPLSGTVSGITGSISSAIVDADNYYANGMSSESGDVSIAGYTVTYINGETTGTQPAIDVIVRYDISDTASVTVNHVYYINGVEVQADVTNAPTTSLTLTKGVSQAITKAEGTVTYNGTQFDLSKFTKLATTESDGFSTNGLNVTLNKFNAADGVVTVRYDLIVREITVTEIFKDSTSTLGTETSKLYVADGDSYTFTSDFNSYDGIEITNFSREITDGYTLGAGVPATFTATASADAAVTITYTVGTQAEVTVNHEYYINGTKVTPNVSNAPTTKLVVNKGVSQEIVLAQGTVDYNGTAFDLSKFTAVASTASDGFTVDGLNVTLNKFNVANGVVTVRYDLTVRAITVTEVFKNSTSTIGTETSVIYVADGDSYTFTSAYDSYNGIAISEFSKSISAGYTLGAGDVATFTATASADANVTITYTVVSQANVTVNHEYYINGTKVTGNVTEGTTSLTVNYNVAQSIEKSTGTVTYNGTSFDLSKFAVTASTSSNGFAVEGLDVTLNAYNVTSGEVTVRYDLTVREITVTEVFNTTTATLGTETTVLYVADGDSYTFTSAYNSYNGVEISKFSKTISDGYTLGAGDVATFTATASADAGVTITYTIGTQANVTVNHVYYINGNPVSAELSNAPTTSLVLNKDVAQAITTAQGTVDFNGTIFNLSDFAASVSATSNGIEADGLNVTLTEYNVAEGTVTVRYDLTVYTVNVTEIFAKDAVTVETATKTAYIKAGDNYTFTSDYANDSIISDVALGDYIRTAQGADVTTAANGAATFTASDIAANVNVTINYAVSTKIVANVEYVYIVNGVAVSANDFTAYTQGASTMNLVYGQAIAAPSSTGTYTLGNDSYTLANDFTKTVTVTGAANAEGNNVVLNAYNVADNAITVTVTYEITVSNEAGLNVFHTYYINGTELSGSALDNVTTGTSFLNLEYGVSQTIAKSTGTVNYNGTQFDLSQFDVTASYNADILSMNGLDVTLIRHNVGAQNVTLRYDLTVYTVVVNEVFFINGIEQTGDAVTNTYYVSAKDAALTAGLVNGSTTVNGVAVSNFIASVSDNSDAIDGAITAGKYVATVNGSGIVTVEYNVSTKTNVNITSIFKVNGSTDGVDTSNVTNAAATQTFEYGVSTPVTSLAGGYVIWNGTQLNVSDFAASITNYDVETIAASGLNVTVNKYNKDATDIVITYTINVVSVTLTENFIVDGATVETQVTTKYYPINSDYVFVSNYGNAYVPAGTDIALSNFTVYGGNKNSDGFVEFTGTASDNAAFTVDYEVTTTAYAVVKHVYFFNGEEITPVITSNGTSGLNLTYGVSTPITLAQGTYVFNGKTFNLSDADVTVTSSNGLVDIAGTNVTLNAYNQTATEITVRYDLSTVVVNITETVVTDNGAHSLVVGTQSIYLLEGEAFEFVSTHAPSDTIVVNGVEIPYSLFTKTVTGADGFTVDTSSNVTISGTMEGKRADIEIVYSGVKTTATVKLYQRYYYRNSVGASGTAVNGHYYVTIPGLALNVGDRITLSSENDDLTFTVKDVTLTVNTTAFTMRDLKSNGIDGHIEGNEFVIDSIAPNTAEETTVDLNYYIDLFDDVNVIHEFYVNGKLADEATINETVTNVVVAAATGYSTNYKIAQKTSGTVTIGGTKYNIAEFTVDDSLIQTTGLTIKRSAVANKFAVQSYDYSTDERTVVIRYDIITTLESTDATVNKHYVNAGNYIGSLFETVTGIVNVGDEFDMTVTKEINGIPVEFTYNSDASVATGITVEEIDGKLVVTEIDAKAAEWKLDIVYTANAVANVNLTHNFYVGGKLLGTITDSNVLVNLAYHSGKLVARNGIVAVTTDKGIVLVDASRFEVSLASGAEYGTFADGIYTLNADALNGSTYNVVFDYNIDSINYALDGEVGIKQTASAITTDGQYNVITTVTSIGNSRPIDLVFVVDVSEGMVDNTDEKLSKAKAAIAEYIENSFAANRNVRVAIVTYAENYEILTDGYITDKDAALAAVEGITVATGKDGYNITTSNLQAGLYGARTLMNSDVRRAYTDVIVIKGSDANAAYSEYNETSYNYSNVTDATADEANAAVAYELDKMNADKEIVIDLTNAETDINKVMTDEFDARNYINVNGKVYITVNSDEFNFVEANGVKVNGNAVAYTYEAGVIVLDLGTLKGTANIEYTLELINKVDGDYFVSDEIKVTYTDAVDAAVETRYGVSARVSYSTTITGATITVIPYLADSELKPLGAYGFAIEIEDAIIGKPIVYAVSGVTNLTAGNTYTVKAPVVSGYTLQENEESVKTVEIPAEGANAVVYFGYYASGTLVDDSIVYDEVSTMVFDVLANDARPNGATFDTIYGIGATEAEAKAGNTAKVETAYGSLVVVDGGKVKYSPNGISVTGEFYYAVQDGDDIQVGKIYVVPATIIKTDSSNNVQLESGDRWQLVDESGNIVSESDNVSDVTANNADDIYGGYDDDNADNFGFDGGNALYANRYKDYTNNGKVDGTNAQYTTSFTFTGTGFDVISVTGNAGGYVTIKTRDSAGNIVSKASGNVSTFAPTENIYQATIFTCTDLTLDTYTVEIIALRTYLPSLGMTDTQVYVDSVRTYNPFADNTNEHYNDLNDGTVTETLKDIFVDGNLAVSTEGNGLFTQSGNLDINSYMDKGTNNAINIIGGQSLLFKLDDASVYTSFQVEMAAVNNSATVEVYVNSKLVETLTVDTGVFAYYDFSSYIREDSTVNFKVVNGTVVFTKVRYKDAVLGEPEGEKYTSADLANGTAPDSALMSEDYTVNTARLIRKSGASRTITALVYTSTNADNVIIYAGGYRIAPTSISVKTNSAGTQDLFTLNYVLPDDVPAGEVTIDFYAYDSANNVYSSNPKNATYTLS